jgi:16S rRNA (adenine1518-N6/adenine1519-N6)-dimethyltransferase
MKQVVRQTRSYLIDLFKKQGINPRTDLGQNFLIDLNILELVVENAKLTPHDVVLEIGSGTGGMTTFLAQMAAHVITVEVDPNMFRMATEQTSAFENITLINSDALKNKNHFAAAVTDEIDRQLAVDPRRKLKLVANLPYSIGTPVISNLIASDYKWARMVVTIQLELAQKMKAPPGLSTYGSLTVWLQTQTNVRLLKKLPPSVFWPRPGVNSAVVLITPKPQSQNKIDHKLFFQDFIRQLFTQRRKLLRSALVSMYRKDLGKGAVDQLLKQLKIDPNARAETMTPNALAELANAFFAVIDPEQSQQLIAQKLLNANLPEVNEDESIDDDFDDADFDTSLDSPLSHEESQDNASDF